MKLNNQEIKNLKCNSGQKGIKKALDKNMYILVTDTGSKLFRFRYIFNGKHKDISLGKYPQTTLEQARSKADEFRLLLSNSTDPMRQKLTKVKDLVRV